MTNANLHASTARQTAMVLFLAITPRPPARCPPAGPVASLLHQQSVRYPAAGVPDIYKLLYQMTLGSEHATRNSAMARAWLVNEWRALPALPPGVAGEPLIDTLGAGPFARVNLRPYIARHGDQAALLAAFLRTGERVHGSLAALHCAEAAAVAAARKHPMRWRADSLQDFFAAQARGGDTAVDHSPEYEARYRPAYRVVALTELRALGVR